MIFTEAIFMGIIGIIIGFILAIFIANSILCGVNSILNSAGYYFKLTITVKYMVLAILLIAINIYLSVLIPSIKASSTSVIQGIRNNKQIKYKGKNMEISEASEEKNIAGGYVDESFRTGSEQNVTYNDMASVTDKVEASDGTLHIDVESGDGRYRQDNGRRLRNTVRNYRGRVDNRYDNHVEARRDVYRADHKNDPRTDYRQDRRTDSRYDNRYDNRNDNRNDNRYDNRNDNRNDNRYDNRNDNRYDNRYDNRAESRVEIKYDNRTDSRCENRQDNRYDSRTDNRTDSRYDNSDIQPPTPENNEALYNELDSGKTANGILEVMPEGFGFIRSANYMPGDQDIYVSPAQIRRLGLKTGDIISGSIRVKTQGEKFSALLYVNSVNDLSPETIAGRKSFEDLTPIFPNERIVLDGNNSPVPIRMIDLLAPIGKGQRGMIVSPPKTGKTTLLKQIAKSLSTSSSTSSDLFPSKALCMAVTISCSFFERRRSSLLVPDLAISMAGNILFSDSFLSRTSSILPVPLNSSNTTSSILLPVSTKAVASIVRLPPSLIFLAAPKNFLGI